MNDLITLELNRIIDWVKIAPVYGILLLLAISFMQNTIDLLTTSYFTRKVCNGNCNECPIWSCRYIHNPALYKLHQDKKQYKKRRIKIYT